MPDFLIRLHAELQELTLKVAKLEDFLAKPHTIDGRAFELLTIQLNAMKTYQSVLALRIAEVDV